jgi:hypothetical protein
LPVESSVQICPVVGQSPLHIPFRSFWPHGVGGGAPQKHLVLVASIVQMSPAIGQSPLQTGAAPVLSEQGVVAGAQVQS